MATQQKTPYVEQYVSEISERLAGYPGLHSQEACPRQPLSIEYRMARVNKPGKIKKELGHYLILLSLVEVANAEISVVAAFNHEHKQKCGYFHKQPQQLITKR